MIEELKFDCKNKDMNAPNYFKIYVDITRTINDNGEYIYHNHDTCTCEILKGIING